MHSRLKILENYNNSEVNKIISEYSKFSFKIQLLIKSLGFLYGFYADTHDANMRDIVRTLKSTGLLILILVPYDSFIMESQMARNLFSHYGGVGGARSPSQRLYLLLPTPKKSEN